MGFSGGDIFMPLLFVLLYDHIRKPSFGIVLEGRRRLTDGSGNALKTRWLIITRC
jgi:hypothetical protein